MGDRKRKHDDEDWNRNNIPAANANCDPDVNQEENAQEQPRGGRVYGLRRRPAQRQFYGVVASNQANPPASGNDASSSRNCEAPPVIDAPARIADRDFVLARAFSKLKIADDAMTNANKRYEKAKEKFEAAENAKKNAPKSKEHRGKGYKDTSILRCPITKAYNTAKIKYESAEEIHTATQEKYGPTKGIKELLQLHDKCRQVVPAQKVAHYVCRGTNYLQEQIEEVKEEGYEVEEDNAEVAYPFCMKPVKYPRYHRDPPPDGGPGGGGVAI